MLAPSGGGLILYQTYGNLYAMTAFGGNTHDLGLFGEELDKTTDLHQHLLRISTQKLETASQITRDAVTTHLKTASQDLQTTSECRSGLREFKTSCRSPSDDRISHPRSLTSSTTASIFFSSIDFSLSSSTTTCLLRWTKLVDAILLNASTFLFSPLGTCLMENS
ncbi:hypothetical protein Tco_1071177 [Tanacetum coccineum]|uniref:Uncharacterized protein n=1 Tax=Tanacetum coccineum TaxID=301880 RepID=A0ABQ5HQ97_9ASTR